MDSAGSAGRDGGVSQASGLAIDRKGTLALIFGKAQNKLERNAQDIKSGRRS